MKKIITVILAAIMAVSLAACSGEGGTNNSIQYTDYNLISNGSSEYTVVIPTDNVYNERLASDEIVNFFYEATGFKLNTATDSEVSYSADSKLILLGDTAFTEQSGINTQSLGEQSYTVKTVDSNVFIYGGDDLGTLYGAYEFLSHTINYAIYAEDEIYVDTGITDRKLASINVTDSPDILWREPNYGPLNNVTTATRFRMQKDIWMTQRGNFVHNTFSEYLPKSTYQAEHPQWYAQGTGVEQLCYTAWGDEAELQAMQDAVLNRMKELVTYYYERGMYPQLLSFTQEDYNTWCLCEKCTEEKEHYGTHSAALIHFINPVSERLTAWLEETYPGHSVTIAIFAYYATEAAPVNKVNGEYVAIDDTVYLHDNVAIFYAPIWANYHYSFNHDKNYSYKETLEKWNVLADKLCLWTYNTNFSDYLVWYDSFNSMQEIYQMAKSMNAIYLFDEGRYNADSLTAFDTLKLYLNCNLAWDTDADVNALTDAFFANYFKDAAVPMQKYYDSYRAWSEYLKSNTNISGSIGAVYSSKYFPKQVLNLWNDYIEEAYTLIEPLKLSNSELYQKLYDRILAESIAIRFHLIEYHSTTYDSTTLKAMRISFKADADRLGFTKFTEGTSLQDSIYSQWGI